MFKYSLDLGEYKDDTRLSISADVKHGVSKDDYDKIRDHFNGLEKIFSKYYTPKAVPDYGGEGYPGTE